NKYKTAPTVGADGTIYLAGDSLFLIALKPDGSARWQYKINGKNKFLGSVSLNRDDTTVYVADEGGTVHALDAATGKNKWQYDISVTTAGPVVTSPLVGADGTLYVATV